MSIFLSSHSLLMEEHAPLVRDTHDNGYGLMGVAKEHFIRDTIVCIWLLDMGVALIHIGIVLCREVIPFLVFPLL